ncbi:SAM hydrolase/SAM-dependent halogenase family protein [Oceanobacillus halophilus]|uniref:DNA-directed RNA polymerase subunit delta n=1 Tax=Oceanobacillus halophilus TaxID=930130 RepID=A0A495A2Y3_9BACI|nr:S-adenosyl-l-methionine hydroxide adenosyltransferase family protein [Oceanobacillus halophilus]RKQ33864.1 DNA-directed RNA polymerase subunit delta [Oceanobacillus halophilus]
MRKHIILQTDFGLSDGAVSAMYGVALSVDPWLRIFDLTHDIPPFNIWEASYRLYQTVEYWPEDSVFVSVVDPGVGTDRLSVVVKTGLNQYIVTPDNGTLTHIKDKFGIVEARIIEEEFNRLPNSGESYTFHGRDVYVYTAARLASGIISFEDVGPELSVENLTLLPLAKTEVKEKEKVITGNIDILDVRFGNLWTNIERELFVETGVLYGDFLEVTIENNKRHLYKNMIKFVRSFADSRLGEALLFVNSLDKIGVAINQGSFAKAYHIETGDNWKISFRKVDV